MKAAINGLGRIGRSVLRAAMSRGAEIDWAAVNDVADPQTLAHLLRYDSLLGPYPGEVRVTEEGLEIDGHRIAVLGERDPSRLPWRELGVDIVLEATGLFTARDRAAAHLQAGASKVVVSAPAAHADLTVVMGVNDGAYDPERHHVISNASCTTNCLAPVAGILHESIGIRHGLMTTIHAYTADQRLQDAPHADLRRARAAAVNLVPASTGAAKALGLVLPALEGRLHGSAIRAPVLSGSLVDLAFEAERSTSVAEVNGVLAAAAADPARADIMQYTEEPLVSSDILGNPHSSIVDGGLTAVIDGTFVKVISWYDNEWGYSNRCVDLLEKVLRASAPQAAPGDVAAIA